MHAAWLILLFLHPLENLAVLNIVCQYDSALKIDKSLKQNDLLFDINASQPANMVVMFQFG